MKFAIVFAAVLAVSSAQVFNARPFSSSFKAQPTYSPPRAVAASAPRSSNSDQNANIVKLENDINPDGSFSYAFETDNGIAANAQGTPRDFGGNPPVVPVVIQGAYSFYSPEGEPISISYVADENGYQPQGSAIPTPPPVPPQIARALEYLAKNVRN
ncbi:hypothetical protein ABMA27_015375 [Loxostege sticticalis]|uniref:Uncharacterized protein n=1 Tax=Loxostege sticticalis TaxID=481309 RepID=A0ABR3I7F1_LOXSC